MLLLRNVAIIKKLYNNYKKSDGPWLLLSER